MIRMAFTINQHRDEKFINDAFENLIKTNFYDGIEIFYPYDINNQNLIIYKDTILKNLKNYKTEVILHMPHGRNNNIATKVNIKETMRRLFKSIDFASNFNVNKLTFHPGFIDGTLSDGEAILESIKNIKLLCKYANKYQMDICLENLVGRSELFKTPCEIDFFLKKINEKNCKVTFDVAHYYASQIDEEPNISTFIESLKNEIKHIHISDNHSLTDEHLPIGKGNIDFLEFFRKLKEVNYTGLVTTEVLFNTIQDLQETLEKVRVVERMI